MSGSKESYRDRHRWSLRQQDAARLTLQCLRNELTEDGRRVPQPHLLGTANHCRDEQDEHGEHGEHDGEESSSVAPSQLREDQDSEASSSEGTTGGSSLPAGPHPSSPRKRPTAEVLALFAADAHSSPLGQSGAQRVAEAAAAGAVATLLEFGRGDSRPHAVFTAVQLVLCYIAGRLLGHFLKKQWSYILAWLAVWAQSGSYTVAVALRDALPDLTGRAMCCILLMAGQLGFLALPKDAEGVQRLHLVAFHLSLLLLMARLLRAWQIAAELLFSSRILWAQETVLWQNHLERRVLAQLLREAGAWPSNSESCEVEGGSEPALEGAAEAKPQPEKPSKDPLAFERACAGLIAAGHPSAEIWIALANLGDTRQSASCDELSPSGSKIREEARPRSAPSTRRLTLGARQLFSVISGSKMPGARLTLSTFKKVLPDNDGAHRFWSLLRRLDAAAQAAAVPTEPPILTRMGTQSQPVSRLRSLRQSQSMVDMAPQELPEQPNGARRSKERIGRSSSLKSSGGEGVGQGAFVELILSTHAEALKLVASVSEHSAVFALYRNTLWVLRAGTLTVLSLGALAPSLLHTLSWLLSSAVLAISFAYGPILLEMMQSLVLLLHIRPFDTGDKVVFRGQTLVVVQVRLLSTVFRNLYNEVTYLRNAAIYAEVEGLVNLRRSGPAAVIELLLPCQYVTPQLLRNLGRFARSYTAVRPQTWLDGKVVCSVFPTAQGKIGVVVAMESFPQYSVRWRVSTVHQLSKEHVAQVRVDATRFLAALVEEAARLGVEWVGSPSTPQGEVEIP